MLLNTASQVISLARKLEEDGAAFYETLAQRYPQHKETLLTFARENKKNISQVERAYYDVISDALEGCFAFELDPKEYETDTKLTDKSSLIQALQKALDMEERTAAFYTKAAEQSKSLLADVPRVFLATAKKRVKRLEELRALS